MLRPSMYRHLAYCRAASRSLATSTRVHPSLPTLSLPRRRLGLPPTPTPTQTTAPARTLFSFFSNSEFYKQPPGECTQQPEPLVERDPEKGALKSRLKHDRHDAVVADTTSKRSILLEGSTRVVLTAMVSNTCLMGMKFFAAFSTNSPSMFAGFTPWPISSTNAYCFSVVMRASRQPDSLHPYGFSRERYAWSLLSGCGIFFLGGGVSMYHGITGILNPHLAEDLHLAFMVLAGSAVFEGGTAMVALKQVRKAAEESEMGVLDYIKKGADPTAVQILLEDAAAISGVAVASTCLGLSYYTGNPLFDALGSTLIGGILGTTAIFLIRRNMAMLVETSMPPHREALVVSTLLADPIVKSVHDVKSTAIGLDGARFKAEVQFDGRLVAQRLASMEGVDWEKERDKVLGMQDKDELARYLEDHGERVVEQLAEEVDRIELKIKKTVPEVKHIDLEIL